MRIFLLWSDRIWMHPPWLQTTRYLYSTVFHLCRVRQVHRRLLLPQIQLTGGDLDKVSSVCTRPSSWVTGTSVSKLPVQKVPHQCWTPPPTMLAWGQLGQSLPIRAQTSRETPQSVHPTWQSLRGSEETRMFVDKPPDPDNPNRSRGDGLLGPTLISNTHSPDPGVKNSVC